VGVDLSPSVGASYRVRRLLSEAFGTEDGTMTTRQVTLLGVFLLLAAGTHAAVERLLPAAGTRGTQQPIASGVLEEATADAKFVGRFAKGDGARVYDRFVVVDHGGMITMIPTDQISGVVLRRE
jgi:hypothetical protein